MNFDHRYFYIIYLIVAAMIGFYIDEKYNFSQDPQDTISLIANLSEFLGLAIALTEIFILTKLTSKIKKNLESFRSYTDVSIIPASLSQIKDDLISEKYGKATLRLEKIRDIYQESLPSNELENTSSSHRINFDKLNSIISTLLMMESLSLKLKEHDLEDYVKFLTTFNKSIISLKLTFKDSIL
ncbi:hypothetical protein KJK34_14825 [Flavobacterium sp. D11R37]|uniref:hypothetical protein n=1 Tax=Flavobacterium coralii TaxID=2838017 RepID=UPI001CA77930|nr:hypothetical protein [Flavobacterium coralii]MBY8964028.1 hypothetical protein [Flavobacterium coralii]